MAGPASLRHTAALHVACLPPCFCSGLAAASLLTQQHPSSATCQPQRPRPRARVSASLLPFLLRLLFCAASAFPPAALPPLFRWQPLPDLPFPGSALQTMRAPASASLPCPCSCVHCVPPCVCLYDCKRSREGITEADSDCRVHGHRREKESMWSAMKGIASA